MDDAPPEHWEDLVDAAAAAAPGAIPATVTVRTIGLSKCRPVWVRCEDGNVYAVKVPRTNGPSGRSIFVDYVAGRLGLSIEAPVAQVALIALSDAQRTSQSFDGAITSIAHGSMRVDGVRDTRKIAHQDQFENQERFASLAVLYGWLGANDRQYLFSKSAPYLVYSVDHGDFFPQGPEWTIGTLEAELQYARPDPYVLTESGVGIEEQRLAAGVLIAVSDREIAEAVSSPPDSWGVNRTERARVLRYLSLRRDILAEKIMSR